MTDATMVYASASKGFRAGGAQANFPGCSLSLPLDAVTHIRSDTLWTYEIGAKAQLPAVLISGAAYDIEWSKLQQQVALSCGFYAQVNGNHARVRGAELEATGRAGLPGLQFRLGVGYEDTDITDPGNPPPVVTPHNQTVAYNQTVPLTSVFSVPGNAVSYIVFFGYPEGGAPALGSVTFLGNPIIQDQSVQIANLADLAYTGAAVRGTDKIWLKAYNGTWSNWAEADITDPGVGGQLGGAVALAAPAVAGVPSGSNTATQPDLADMSLFSNYMASAFPPSGAGMTSTATSAGSESNALADLVASHG